MKHLFITLVFLASFYSVAAQSKEEKINVSYWYVFGRFPNAGELGYWNGQPDQSISWYITNHQNYLRADDKSNTEAVVNSYKDAFGRQPNNGELEFWKKQKRSYADLMNEHVLYLLKDAAENKSTINRAYQAVYSRAASNEEMNYWTKSNFSYLILTCCLRSYKSSGYKLQSVEGIVNFMKGAWETSANFVINTGSAIYNATTSAVSGAIAAGQRILTLATSKQLTNDIKNIDSKIFAKTEDGREIMTGGGSSMKGINQVIGLNGATLVSDKGAALIAAGGLN